MRKQIKPGQKAVAKEDIGDPADKGVPGKMFIEKGEDLIVISVDENRLAKYPLMVSRLSGGSFYMATYSEVNPIESKNPFQ